jgi:hypothetical protein
MDTVTHEIAQIATFVAANPLNAVVVIDVAFLLLFDRLATKVVRVIDRLIQGRSDK